MGHEWTAGQLGAAHTGRPGALLPDGTEPGPVYYDIGSGSHVPSTTQWDAYDGTLGAPRASHVRAVCSCGWRGDKLYKLDWDRIAEAGGAAFADMSGPRGDWARHSEEVVARMAPLPPALEALLVQLHDQVCALADDAPLSALRAVAAVERTAREAGRRAAYGVEARDLPDTDVATALGLSESTARSVLLGYALRE
ncbi:hypothetical protein WDH52_22725 [Streptomyces sp. TRM70308]|uniref:hypothetical protein n=1 Tax=Streptomyces sp. TRM70308 TaxID=3131932 RepID=UPI003CFDE037